MDPLTLLKSIPLEHQPGAEIFAAWRKGDLGWDDAMIHVAIRESEHAHEERPEEYLPMNNSIRDYCQNRIDDSMSYDYSLALRLGNWVYGIQRAHDHNSHLLEQFLWAKEKLIPAKLLKDIARLDHAIQRFIAIRLPDVDLSLAMATKKLDANAKIRKFM